MMTFMTQKNSPLVQTNARIDPFHDLYHWMILQRWPQFIGVLGLCFLVINLIFGGLYYLIGGLVNVKSGFLDHVFFSVHTMATVGYGNVYPEGVLTNCIAAFEIMLGLFMMALITGLIFAKFSRPTARILFSRYAVIHQRNGVDCLVFRMANARSHHVAEASLNVAALKHDVTPEGDHMRKLHTLTLERSQTPLFVLSWMVFHPITPDSPLFGLSHQDMIAGDVRLLLSLTGYDSIVGQTIHTRHIYYPEDIKLGYRLKDALTTTDSNALHLDFDMFHDIEPV